MFPSFAESVKKAAKPKPLAKGPAIETYFDKSGEVSGIPPPADPPEDEDEDDSWGPAWPTPSTQKPRKHRARPSMFTGSRRTTPGRPTKVPDSEDSIKLNEAVAFKAEEQASGSGPSGGQESETAAPVLPLGEDQEEKNLTMADIAELGRYVAGDEFIAAKSADYQRAIDNIGEVNAPNMSAMDYVQVADALKMSAEGHPLLVPHDYPCMLKKCTGRAFFGISMEQEGRCNKCGTYKLLVATIKQLIDHNIDVPDAYKISKCPQKGCPGMITHLDNTEMQHELRCQECGNFA